MSSLPLAGHISRYYKLTATRAPAAVINFGWPDGAPNFFPSATARNASGWGRRRNSAAEGSTTGESAGRPVDTGVAC